jgi:rhamnogalacturonyl hydrolase YesR
VKARLIAVAIVAAAAIGVDAEQEAPSDRTPLEIARVLAGRYPAAPIMSYIPALSWSGALRLAELTGEDRWKQKARAELQPFVSGERPAIAEPYLLTSLAGHLALFDLGEVEAARKAADFIMPASPGDPIKYGRGWTDDMFMATTLLARVASRSTAAQPEGAAPDAAQPEGAAPDADRYARAVAQLLTSYARKLQRPDGLFIHAADGPHAWGRGNGFALLGTVEALTYLPEAWPERSRVLEIYRTHVAALARHQSDDGSWRQVVDEPGSYRELTVTAMTVAAMARGVRRGWLDRASSIPAIERGWRAVVARVNGDGTVRDVCSGTGAGPTKEYYLNRPVVNGADDRGGAMALLAALEVAQLGRK